MSQWPTLRPELSRQWQRDLDAVISELVSLADAVSPYPGGGSPAHCMRVAADATRDARRRLEGITPDA